MFCNLCFATYEAITPVKSATHYEASRPVTQSDVMRTLTNSLESSELVRTLLASWMTSYGFLRLLRRWWWWSLRAELGLGAWWVMMGDDSEQQLAAHKEIRVFGPSSLRALEPSLGPLVPLLPQSLLVPPTPPYPHRISPSRIPCDYGYGDCYGLRVASCKA